MVAEGVADGTEETAVIRPLTRLTSSAPRRAALGLTAVAMLGAAMVVARACTAATPAAVSFSMAQTAVFELTPDRAVLASDGAPAAPTPAVIAATSTAPATAPGTDQTADVTTLAAIRSQCVASWQSWRATDAPEDTAESAAWRAAMAQGAASAQAAMVNDIAEDASERSARLATMAPCLAAIRAFAAQEKTEAPGVEPALLGAHTAPLVTAPHTSFRTWSFRDSRWSWWGGRTERSWWGH